MSILEELGIDFEGYLGGTYDGETLKRERALEKYKSLKESEGVSQIRFSYTDEKGNLIKKEDGIEIVLCNQDILGQEYDLSYRADMLNKEYSVRVTDVDEENGKVYVSHFIVKANDQTMLDNAIRASLDEGKVVELPAKIVRLYNNMAIIDIGGLGIPGFIKVKDWSISYTSDLTKCGSKRGEIVKVRVNSIGKLSGKQVKRYFSWTNRLVYECSRKEAMSYDPWEGIKDTFKNGMIVTIECVSKEDNYFYGKIEGYNELNVYGLYPNKKNELKKGDILPGDKVECVIKTVDVEKKIFRVKAFRMAERINM